MGPKMLTEHAQMHAGKWDRVLLNTKGLTLNKQGNNNNNWLILTKIVIGYALTSINNFQLTFPLK